MKQFILTAFLIFVFSVLPAAADIRALSSRQINYCGIGVLNIPAESTIYEAPDINSKVLFKINYKSDKNSAIVRQTGRKKLSYITYIPSKNIALLAAVSDNADGWFEVVVNQHTGKTGWIYTNDTDAFLTYKSLFYKYGRKYGIKMFNDLPEDKKILRAGQSDESQKLGELSHPEYMTFTVIRGNWMLVTARSSSNQADVGWYRWRNDSGALNVFPDFK